MPHIPVVPSRQGWAAIQSSVARASCFSEREFGGAAVSSEPPIPRTSTVG
jgi:hypothetical protein